jgi:flagellar M-ring protein FliF
LISLSVVNDEAVEFYYYLGHRIQRQIAESPYKIRDLGIQVLVEPPIANKPKSLPKSTENDIKNILGTIVRTSIDKSSISKPLTNKDINKKIVVSVQPFKGSSTETQQTKTSIPWWIYAVGGLLLAGIILLLFVYLRSRKEKYDEDLDASLPPEPLYVPDVNEEQENEGTVRRKQLEKMAKEHPEDFAKLLRTWIAED